MAGKDGGRAPKREGESAARQRGRFQETAGEREADASAAIVSRVATNPAGLVQAISASDGTTRTRVASRMQREMGNVAVQRILTEAHSSGKHGVSSQPRTAAVQRQGIEEYEKILSRPEVNNTRTPADDLSDSQRWGQGQAEGEVSWWDSLW